VKRNALCDKYGIYLMDEANLESHGVWGQLASLPEWRGAYVERIERLIARDYNHASVIIWSLGNESGQGTNIVDMGEICRRMDPSRPWHYEPRSFVGDPRPSPIGDLISNMYVSKERMVRLSEYDTTRPVILCEVRSKAYYVTC